MTSIGRSGIAAAALAALLAGCGGEGGELREATERRRAAGVVEEPAPAPPRAGDTVAAAPDRLPVFVRDGAGEEVRTTDPAVADTGRPASPAPPAGAEGSWTAGTHDVVRTQRGAVTLLDVRAGANEGFDRVVMEFTGDALPGHRVEYVDRPVRECGSGRTVAVAGDGWLAITLRATRAHTDDGRATVERRNRRVEMPVLRQVVFTCDFEGVVQVVLGVSSPNAYRVTELRNPSRLVVDVRH